MLESVLFSAMLMSAPPPAQTFLYVDESAESAAAVASAVRFEPATGRASTATRNGAGSWSRARHERARTEGRSRFSLVFEPGAGRLIWRVGAEEPVVETVPPAASGVGGPNLLRLELANFDREATLAVEKLELALDGGRRELRELGHEAMTRDLVTLFGPELARGFRLTGELVLRGSPVAPGRLFVDFGLGRGRRVEVEVDGEGSVESVPPRVVRAGRRKSAIGYFAPEESAVLRAIGGGFREWESGGVAFAERDVDLARGSGDSPWTARFEPAVADFASAGSGASPKPEGSINFSNPAAILVPSGQPATTTGKASPYPSTINVSGPVTGGLSDVDVLLKDVTHSYPDDLDVVIVTPHGTALLILSDACGSTGVTAVDWRIDDDAAAALADSGPCASGNFKTSVYDGASDLIDAPAPPGPYPTTFDTIFGENVNGTWELYVFDDLNGDYGSIAGGWELAFNTSQSAMDIPGTGSSGVASPYPYTRTVAATEPFIFGPIVDLNVYLFSLWHQYPGDIDLLLVGPNGDTVLLMSDACGSVELEDTGWTFDDEAAAPLSEDATGCASGQSVRPAAYGSSELLPAPAPAGPYGSALSVFDGDDPVGTWEFYVQDDSGGDVGFVSNYFSLQFKTQGIFRDGFEGSPCIWQSIPAFPECND